MVTPRQKSALNAFLRTAAEANPVKIVAMDEEYFFKIVSDSQVHLTHLVAISLLFLQCGALITSQENIINLPAYLKKNEDKIPCRLLLMIMRTVNVLCPLNRSRQSLSWEAILMKMPV